MLQQPAIGIPEQWLILPLFQQATNRKWQQADVPVLVTPISRGALGLFAPLPLTKSHPLLGPNILMHASLMKSSSRNNCATWLMMADACILKKLIFFYSSCSIHLLSVPISHCLSTKPNSTHKWSLLKVAPLFYSTSLQKIYKWRPD